MNHDYGIIGGKSMNAATTTRVSETDRILEAFDRLDDVLTSVVHVVGRIAGTSDTGGETGPAPPRSPGVLPGLRDRAIEVEEFSRYVGAELNRLEAML